MELYYHVGSIDGPYVFNEGDLWPRISKRSFSNEVRSEVEKLVEKYRPEHCFSRYTSLFVVKTEEEALAWANRKKINKFFVYELAYDGQVNWHISDYYDRCLELLKKEKELFQNGIETMPEIKTPKEAAELYWEEHTELNNGNFYYEGLIEGRPKITKRIRNDEY